MQKPDTKNLERETHHAERCRMVHCHVYASDLRALLDWAAHLEQENATFALATKSPESSANEMGFK